MMSSKTSLARLAPGGLSALGCALVLAAGVFLFRYLSFTEFGNDHFIHLSQAQQILHGELPVRDFVERGIPLMTATSAAAQRIWGEGLRAEVFLVAGAYALAAALTFLAATAIGGSAWLGMLATLSTVAIFPVSYSYPKLLLYAVSLVGGLLYARRPTPARSIGLAALIAIAFLFRHDHGLVVALAVVALIATCHELRAFGKVALRIAIVALVGVSPFLMWVQVHQGLGAYVAQGLAFSRREAERADPWWRRPEFAVDRSRPMWSSLVTGPVVHIQWRDQVDAESIARGEERHSLTRVGQTGPKSWHYELRWWGSDALRRLADDGGVARMDGVDRETLRLEVPAPTGIGALFAKLNGPGYGLRLRANGVAVWFYLIWIVPLVSLAILVGRWRTIEASVRSAAVAAVVMQLLMNVTMVRDPLTTRIRDVLVPAAVLLAFVLAPLWQLSGRRLARGVSRGVAAIALLGLLIVSGAVGEARDHLDDARVFEGVEGVRTRLRELRRVVLAGDTRTGRLDRDQVLAVDYLSRCTFPSSRIFAMTFAPELFFYTHRLFAGGHVSLTPGYFVTDADQDAMVTRLAKEDVPIVLVDSETYGELAGSYPRTMAYVRAHYRDAGRLDFNHAQLMVLADASRPAPTRFRGSSLPCFVP